jgi:ATP-dependent exoDNAse (exonuclease V) beta subunit
MKHPLQVPPDTLRRQATASDPRNSVWVSANAGSGKTHVLAQRVVRLLLGGADPSRILCLTYTRAAAANMSNRVFQTLSAWTMLPDAELAKKVEELEGDWPGAKKLARARKLFTQALETPGGLKVQTIHAFCESVLHQFPLEANIAAHFTMLDSRMEEALFAEARRDMITGAAGEGRPELAGAFAAVLERGGEFGLDQLLAEIVSKRTGCAASSTRSGSALVQATGRSSRCSRSSVLLATKRQRRSRLPFGRCRVLITTTSAVSSKRRKLSMPEPSSTACCRTRPWRLTKSTPSGVLITWRQAF